MTHVHVHQYNVHCNSSFFIKTFITHENFQHAELSYTYDSALMHFQFDTRLCLQVQFYYNNKKAIFFFDHIMTFTLYEDPGEQRNTFTITTLRIGLSLCPIVS